MPFKITQSKLEPQAIKQIALKILEGGEMGYSPALPVQPRSMQLIHQE